MTYMRKNGLLADKGVWLWYSSLIDDQKVQQYSFVGLFLRTRLWSCPGAMDLQFSSAGLSIEPPPARTVIKWSCVDSWEKSWAWKMERRYSFTVSCLLSALFHTQMLHNDTSWQSCDSLNSQLLLRLTRYLVGICIDWLVLWFPSGFSETMSPGLISAPSVCGAFDFWWLGNLGEWA